MVQVNKGEVVTLKFGPLTPEEASQLKEGSFVAAETAKEVACRVTYEKVRVEAQKKEGEEPEISYKVYVTIDARPSRKKYSDKRDPNGYFNTQFEIVPPSSVVDCTLSIDLGNTRTVALLLDQVGEKSLTSNRLPIYLLPMQWRQYPGSEQTGTFESVVSLISPDSAGDEFCGNEARASFVKLGTFADWNSRAFGNHRSSGRYMLSSPKRYFWDHDPADRDWIAAQYLPKDGERLEQNIKFLNGRLADALAQSSSVEPRYLPPADILSAMVVELYEQACYFVGSPAFKKKTIDNRCRHISKIHVTYPSTLLPRELKDYRAQLQKGITAYLNDFPGSPTVTLSSEIDEASSILSVYAYSEIRKSNALFWLQTIGRKSPLGYAARLAVIDVGGGTTDLSIASVEASRANAGVDPFSARIDLICRDGINNAGDALIFDFITNCIAQLGFDLLYAKSGVGGGALTKEALREKYQAPENELKVRELTKSFWFDLAIRVASVVDEIVRRYPSGNVPDSAFEKLTLTYTLSENALKGWSYLYGDQALLQDGDKFNLDIPIKRAIYDAYLKSVETIFRGVARAFANSIAAYDADLLIFSGKTSEFVAVQNIFKRFIALPPSAIKTMKNFQVGNWCGELTNAQGRIADSKVSTTLGGALYSLGTSAFVRLTFVDEVSQQLSCRWGFVSDMGPVAFTHSIFAEGQTEVDVPMAKDGRLIARQMPFAKTAIQSYELRFKPGVLKRHGGGLDAAGAQVRLGRDDLNQALQIISCTGKYNDFTDVQLDDVECRVCSMNGAFMMDNVVELR